jgi:hypothetical protein
MLCSGTASYLYLVQTAKVKEESQTTVGTSEGILAVLFNEFGSFSAGISNCGRGAILFSFFTFFETFLGDQGTGRIYVESKLSSSFVDTVSLRNDLRPFFKTLVNAMDPPDHQSAVFVRVSLPAPRSNFSTST